MKVVSMTGFGAGAVERDGILISVEIRSVNHRFLECAVRLPAVYARWEQDLSRLVKDKLRRGRADITVVRTDTRQRSLALTFKADAFRDYLKLAKNASDVFQAEWPAAAGEAWQQAAASRLFVELFQKREILELGGEETSSAETEWETVEKAAHEAVAKLVAMREAEGARLLEDLSLQLRLLSELRTKVAAIAPSVVASLQARLSSRLEQLQIPAEVRSDRLAQEVAMFADRTDIREEIVRLESHEVEFRSVMERGEGGKKLDFLLQEMLREVNTIGSKAQHAEVAKLVVDAKCVIERLKEQVQNVE